jgi:hypothetical protein
VEIPNLKSQTNLKFKGKIPNGVTALAFELSDLEFVWDLVLVIWSFRTHADSTSKSCTKSPFCGSSGFDLR